MGAINALLWVVKCHSEIMPSATGTRRLTTTEQDQLLDNFYDAIYEDEQHFGDDDAAPGFEDESPEDEEEEAFADDSGDDDGDDTNVEERQDDPNLDSDASDTEETLSTPVRRKQKFTSGLDVTDIDNFDAIPEQVDEKFVWSNKAGERIEWTTRKQNSTTNPTRRGRRPARDLPQPGGPTAYARARATTPGTLWTAMMTDETLLKIVNYTNQKITMLRAILGDRLVANKTTFCGLTSLVEVRAWFGLLYIRGALQLNLRLVDDVWYHETANNLFSATMSRKRFTLLSRIITFDDFSTRTDRWEVDKFASFREFFEAVNCSFLKLRKPSVHLAIDETLYPYRGRIGFKQYNPSKPAKYGLLFRSLCDSALQYMYFCLPYAGKPNGQPNEFYVTKTDEYTKYLVNGAIKIGGAGCLRGRNISLDRYFTSVTIADWLLEKNITTTGTLRSDRKGIPKEMKSDADREEKSTKWCFSEKKMLVSYMDKKKSGKKNVLFLTTMYDEIRVSKDQRVKPQPIVYYDHMKGGVDVVDLVSIGASTRSKTKRWTLNANSFICDTTKTNARTLYNEINNKKLSNFEFTFQLGKELIMPFIQQRSESPLGLQLHIVKKMRTIIDPLGDVPLVNAPPQVNNDVGRCRQCVLGCEGANYSVKHRKLNNKLKNKCMTCGNFLCSSPGHVYYVCGGCKI